VRIERRRIAEQLGEESLRGCRREQIVAAYDLINAGEPIVYNYRQVVGRGSVVALQYDIVNLRCDVAVQQIVHSLDGAIGAQT